MESRLGYDMAFGLKCPAMCFMSRLSLSKILKELATFLSFIIHWKGGSQLLLMHITFGGITIYGKVGYLGCDWLVVCLFLKICMEYGFCWWVFYGLLFLEVWYVVCHWCVLWLVVNIDDFGRQQMQDRYHSYSLKKGSRFCCCCVLLKKRMLLIT